MVYNNIDDLKEEFNITKNKPELIRKELLKIQKNIHPDKNKGKFKSKKDEVLFNKITEAKDFIDNISKEKEALIQVPTSKLTEFIEMAAEISHTNSKKYSDEGLSQHIERRMTEEKTRHRFPKISIAFLTGVLTFLWLFPYQINEHPILNQYIDVTSSFFILIWLDSILITLALWFYYGEKERRTKELMSKLKVESFQNELFELFIGDNRFHERYHDKHHNKGEFLKEDFIEYIIHYFRYSYGISTRSKVIFIYFMNKLSRLFFTIDIDTETAQRLADIVFERVEKKNIIKKVDTKTLSDYYVYNRSAN